MVVSAYGPSMGPQAVTLCVQNKSKEYQQQNLLQHMTEKCNNGEYVAPEANVINIESREILCTSPIPDMPGQEW